MTSSACIGGTGSLRLYLSRGCWTFRSRKASWHSPTWRIKSHSKPLTDTDRGGFRNEVYIVSPPTGFMGQQCDFRLARGTTTFSMILSTCCSGTHHRIVERNPKPVVDFIIKTCLWSNVRAIRYQGAEQGSKRGKAWRAPFSQPRFAATLASQNMQYHSGSYWISSLLQCSREFS